MIRFVCKSINRLWSIVIFYSLPVSKDFRSCCFDGRANLFYQADKAFLPLSLRAGQ